MIQVSIRLQHIRRHVTGAESQRRIDCFTQQKRIRIMTSHSSHVSQHCPEFPPLGDSDDRASELIERLKEKTPPEAEESALWESLKKYKSTPTDLENAYMDIPKIVSYYNQVRDEIDGSSFSEFGSLSANENLLDEVVSCTDGLSNTQKGEVKDLQEKYDNKQKGFEDTLDEAVNAVDQMSSCVEVAEKVLKRKKKHYCDLTGPKAGEEELAYCKAEDPVPGEGGSGESGSAEETSPTPPAGAAARISWWASELVRMFKALGISEERGKKSSVSCESLSVEKIQVYAYSLEIQRVIDKVKSAEATTDAQFKNALDSAWKEWLNATYRFIKQYMIEKEWAEALANAQDNLARFMRGREEKFVRDALDVEADDDGGCN
jgi:hypothetical protein